MTLADFKRDIYKPQTTKSTVEGNSSKTKNLELILEVTKRINHSLVLGDVLELVLKSAIQIANADRGFIVLKEDGDNLNFKLGMNSFDEILPASIFEISTTVVEEVYYSNQSIFIESAQNDYELDPSKSILDLELQTILCSPLIIGKKKIGVIYIDSKRLQKIKIKEITDTFEILANQAAIAINNAQQYTNQKIAHLELQKINKELKMAKEEAEKSDRLKSEFLAQMSHEIRTPINSINNFTSILKEDLGEIIPDEFKDNFEFIENGTKRLIRTIDLILNMSQVQSGTLKPEFKKYNLVESISGLIKEFNNLAQSKNVGLNYFTESEEEIILGDEYTITQIFQNLIDNAIKYTEEGRVEITVGKTENEKLFVSVSDTGIGISEEYMPNLFKPFSQETTGYTRKFDGNGLGLALVKKYAEINNAVIKVESQKGAGSTFTVIFN